MSPGRIQPVYMQTKELLKLIEADGWCVYRLMKASKTGQHYSARYNVLLREANKKEKWYRLDCEKKSEFGEDYWDFFFSEVTEEEVKNPTGDKYFI